VPFFSYPEKITKKEACSFNFGCINKTAVDVGEREHFLSLRWAHGLGEALLEQKVHRGQGRISFLRSTWGGCPAQWLPIGRPLGHLFSLFLSCLVCGNAVFVVCFCLLLCTVVVCRLQSALGSVALPSSSRLFFSCLAFASSLVRFVRSFASFALAFALAFLLVLLAFLFGRRQERDETRRKRRKKWRYLFDFTV